MDDNFFTALFPGRHRVLGRELPPFSLWHLACLHAIKSPFVVEDASACLTDVQLAGKVCRARFPQQPDFRRTLRDVIQRIRFEKNEEFVTREAAAFLFYKSCHEQIPQFWENENERPGGLSAPALLARVASLQRFTNLTHDQIWNDCTPGYACWLVATSQEQEGAEIRFISPEDDIIGTDLPDLNALSDDALFEVIKADMGEEQARAFMERRTEMRREQAS